MSDIPLALPSAAPPVRPRVLLVGTALAAAAAFMGIVALVGIYVTERAAATSGGGSWLPDNAILDLTPGNMAFATMLLSAVPMWWAVDAVSKNDRQMAYLALGITILFGVAVINLTTFLYSELNVGVDTLQGALIFTTTGAHLVMIVAGLVFAAVMTFRTLGGEYQGRDHEGLTAAAIFWYVTIAAHAPIWLAIYVTK